MKKVLSAVGVLGAFLIPVVVLAAPNTSEVNSYASALLTFVNNMLVPLVFAVAFLMFLWGIFKAFIMGGADETKRSEGRQLMLYAVIGFLLMVSIWGIVNVFSKTLGFTGGETLTIPKAPETR